MGVEDLCKRIEDYQKTFEIEASRIKNLQALIKLKNASLGRHGGQISLFLEDLKNLKQREKREAGKLINLLKQHVTDVLDKTQKKLESKEESVESIDLTLPGEQIYWGSPHPLLQIQRDLENIFIGMGFSIEDGPEIESDYYNFEALNFPPEHPARDDWDTLYITDTLLLRTHTSPVQIRVMEKKKPPIRIIIPGKVYRKETPDATHLPMFHQVEGLVIDSGITFAHLKGTLEHFLKSLLYEKIKMRFRPSFFPFTEPSAEVDIMCTVCSGEDQNCRVCGGAGWIEILGAGMVDPQVLKNVNIDPEKFSGFAFGLGIDRIALFAYQISDIRFFYENDLRFLRQFLVR